MAGTATRILEATSSSRPDLEGDLNGFYNRSFFCNSHTNLLVITDRLNKGVILEPMAKIITDTITEVFLNIFYWHYRLLVSIVSDRSTQFVSAL